MHSQFESVSYFAKDTGFFCDSAMVLQLMFYGRETLTNPVEK